MYVVSGCPRSGTSLMMDLCRVAFGEDRILGKKFPQEGRITNTDKRPNESKHEYDVRMYIYNKKVDHKKLTEDMDRVKDMNPNGFWEMKYTVRGVHFRFNDLDNLNKIKEEKHGEKSICKIVSQGLAQSDPQYIDKIVYMVRHPRAVAKSQEKLKRQFPFSNSEEDKMMVNGKEQRIHTPEMYIQVTYAAAEWLIRFPDTPLLQVNFDDLIETPETTLQGVQNFLGDGDFSAAAKQINPKLRRSYSESRDGDLWEDADTVYNLFIQKDYQGILDYAESPKAAITTSNRRHWCARLDETKVEAECKSCRSNNTTMQNYRARAISKGIDWENEPCIYECLYADGKLKTIEESIADNSWAL